MARERAPHMPWYGREFYADENVLVMTLKQEGAYFRLLWNCWQEGSIPTDTAKLAALCKNTPVKNFERDIWPALSGLFSQVDGRLVHRKVELLRNAKEQRRTAWSEAGRRGNEKRWGKDRVTDRVPTETRQTPESGSDHLSISADCRLPITDYQEPNTCASEDAQIPGSFPSIDDPPFETTEANALFPAEPSKPEKPVNGLTAEQEVWFCEWWAAYWLRKARKAARQAFGKHVRTAVRFAEVMGATQAQSPEMLSREPRHRPQGASWRNGERWGDETVIEAAPPVSEVSRILADRLRAKENQG